MIKVAKLKNPANGQLTDVLEIKRGYICLLTTQITYAVRWFTPAQLAKVNKPDDLMAAILRYDIESTRCELLDQTDAERWNSRITYEVQLYREIETALRETTPLVVTLTPDLAANVNASAGVVIKVVPPVTLFHEAMKAA